MTRVVVFAYSEVGVRCLKALVCQGIDVALVVTHQDNTNENVFFDSVADLAADYGLPTIMPASASEPAVIAQLQAIAPDFIFSFYYRHMIAPQVLSIAKRGALNMHGSLLPKYRGRAPTNWAVLRGETETGATLHYMVEKPDAGDIVDQMTVPILRDDDAYEVFKKVTVAAEMVLLRSLPKLIAGTAARAPLIPIPGHYFSARKPDDGRLNCAAGIDAVHNLVRAVAPPYPGAFLITPAGRLNVNRTRIAKHSTGTHAAPTSATLVREEGELRITFSDGALLRILDSNIEDAAALEALLPLRL
jgi:methionyl-tRNA formyltransferase